jgi:hypothetical protein
MEVVVLCGLAAFVGSMLGIAYLAKRTTTEQRFRRTRRTAVAALDENQARKIVGRVRVSGEELEAPLSGRPCVLYEVQVESRTEGSAFFRPVTEVKAVPFWVEEGERRVLVVPSCVRTWLVPQLAKNTGVLHEPPETLLQFLRLHGRSVRIEWGRQPLAYREGTIADGDTVAVIGVPRSEADPEAGRELMGYRMAPVRVRMLASKRQPVLVSNAEGALSS